MQRIPAVATLRGSVGFSFFRFLVVAICGLAATTAWADEPAKDAAPNPAPATAPAAANDAPAAAPQQAAPPPIEQCEFVKITIDTGRTKDGVVTLSGRDARQQLVVTGELNGGSLRDITHEVTYTVEPAGVIAIETTGQVMPLADGRARVTATPPHGPAAAIEFVVERCGHESPISFPNQVVPIFTKLNCNGGGCHGKASGQNGFRLSLLGFEPREDYEHLVNEGRGRRLFPAAPSRVCCCASRWASYPTAAARGWRRIPIRIASSGAGSPRACPMAARTSGKSPASRFFRSDA